MLMVIDDCIHCLRNFSAVKAALCPKLEDGFESLNQSFFDFESILNTGLIFKFSFSSLYAPEADF